MLAYSYPVVVQAYPLVVAWFAFGVREWSSLLRAYSPPPSSQQASFPVQHGPFETPPAATG